MELKDFKFNTNNLSDEVKKACFTNQKKFAKKVMKDHRARHEQLLYVVDSFSEAYDSSYEALGIMLAGMFLTNAKKMEKNQMDKKLSTTLKKSCGKYEVWVVYH